MAFGDDKKKDTRFARDMRVFTLVFTEIIFFTIGIACIWDLLTKDLAIWGFAIRLPIGLLAIVSIFTYPYLYYREHGKFWKVDKGIPKKERDE